MDQRGPLNIAKNQPRLIFKNTAALALSRSIDGVITVVLSFFVARRLGAAGLGIYSASIVFYGLIALAAEMGSTNFLMREIARDRSRTNEYLTHLGTMALCGSVIVMAAARFIVPYLGYGPELRACVYVVICATIPGVWRTMQEAVFVAHQRVEFVTYSTLCSAVVNLCTVLLLLKKGFGIVSLVIAFATVQYVVSICYFLFINCCIQRLHWHLHFSTALQLIKGIRAFAGSSILGGLCARPEVFILSLFRNDAQIGFYSAALRLVSVWAVIPQTFMTNVYPVLANAENEGDRDRSQRILNKSLKYLLASSLPLCFGIFAAAGPIMRVLYGPAFAPSVTSLQIMVWTIPLSFISSVLWRLLAARGEQHLVLRAQVVTAIVRLAGGYALIASFAAMGAALSTTLSLTAQNLLLEVYVRRNGTRLQMFRRNWRLFASVLIMGAGTAIFSNRLHIWSLIPLAAVLYVSAALLLKACTAEDVALFRQALHLPAKKRGSAADRMSDPVST